MLKSQCPGSVQMLLAWCAEPRMQQADDVLETATKSETGAMFCEVFFHHTVVFASNISSPSVKKTIRSDTSRQ